MNICIPLIISNLNNFTLFPSLNSCLLMMLICKHLNQANKGCSKGSEETVAKQGSEGSILCFAVVGDNDEELW